MSNIASNLKALGEGFFKYQTKDDINKSKMGKMLGGFTPITVIKWLSGDSVPFKKNVQVICEQTYELFGLKLNVDDMFDSDLTGHIKTYAESEFKKMSDSKKEVIDRLLTKLKMLETDHLKLIEEFTDLFVNKVKSKLED